MKIANDVHLIASGALGCSLSHDSDCNVYALQCGDEYLLIDSGIGLDSDCLIRNLEADSIPLKRVTTLLLTHYHLDHSGGAAHLRARLGLKVAGSIETAAAVETADEEAISLAAAKRAGLFPEHVRLEPCPVEVRFQGGEIWQLADTSIEVIRAPGHSRDMVNFLVRKPGRLILFSGDTVFHGGKVVLQDILDCDISAYTRTLRHLSGFPIDELYPGHAQWTLRGAYRHLETAMQYINRLLLPPNLV